MAKTNNLTDFLIDLADSIREIEGSSDLINPQDFHDRIINSQPTIYNGETELLIPAVSGVWKFNETILYSQVNISQDVNFVSDGIEYANMRFDYESKDDYNIICYMDERGKDPREPYADGWDGAEEYRTVDFGTTAQEVSEEFYAWLTANAVKQ